MFPSQDGACGDEPICTALPGWSAGAGSRELPLRDPPVKNESSAATQSIAIACDAGRDVVDAVAASSTFGSEEDGPVRHPASTTDELADLRSSGGDAFGGLLWDADDASPEHVARVNESTNETTPDAEPEY